MGSASILQNHVEGNVCPGSTQCSGQKITSAWRKLNVTYCNGNVARTVYGRLNSAMGHANISSGNVRMVEVQA